jgi:hypothetical protein
VLSKIASEQSNKNNSDLGFVPAIAVDGGGEIRMSELLLIGRSAKGEPIYRDVPSQDELVASLKQTAEWQEFRRRFDTTSEPNNRLLGFLFITKLMPDYSGDDPDLEDYKRLIRNVILAGGVVALPTIKNPDGTVVLEAGQYEFELCQAEPEQQPESEVPRDKNGKPLSPSQIAWGEMARWSHRASSQEIKERRRIDPAFASFYRLNIEREARETPSTQFELAGQSQNTKHATPDLIAFAEAYRTTPVEKVRQLRSPAFNALGYKKYIANIEAALAAGLI